MNARIRRPLILGSAALTVWLAPADLPAQRRDVFREARNRMVDEEIVAGGVKSPRVIRAMRNTPRHEFVALAQRRFAYLDMALPIGESQTISPPFVVAFMTEALDPQPDDNWEGYRGFIHEVLLMHYLSYHPAPEDCEYYLCGPPMMNTAVIKMLEDLGVERDNIMLDDFGA